VCHRARRGRRRSAGPPPRRGRRHTRVGCTSSRVGRRDSAARTTSAGGVHRRCTAPPAWTAQDRQKPETGRMAAGLHCSCVSPALTRQCRSSFPNVEFMCVCNGLDVSGTGTIANEGGPQVLTSDGDTGDSQLVVPLGTELPTRCVDCGDGVLRLGRLPPILGPVPTSRTRDGTHPSGATTVPASARAHSTGRVRTRKRVPPRMSARRQVLESRRSGT
jgi:hypothetical protein